MKLQLFYLLLLIGLLGCDDNFIESEPPREIHVYSGEFMLLTDRYITINGETFDRGLGDAPLEFTVARSNSLITYTLYGKQYGIHDIDLFGNSGQCVRWNGTESTIYETDKNGNDVVSAIFPEEFYRECHFHEEVEHPVSFIIKSYKPIM